jgi:hypothetical protein
MAINAGNNTSFDNLEDWKGTWEKGGEVNGPELI